MIEKFYSLNIKEIIKYSVNQNLSFWFLLIYFVFEYLRPQSMYPSIDIIPWSQTILIITALLVIIEKRLFLVQNRSNIAINLFFVIVLLSSIFALSSEMSFSELETFTVLLIVYYLFIYIIDNLQKLFILILFYLFLNFKLSLFTFRLWIGRDFAYDPYGATAGLAWLENSGEFAIEMCIVFAISTFFVVSIWNYITWFKRGILLLIPITSVGSILACGSRGGFLGLAGIMFFMWLWLKGWQKITALAGILLFITFSLAVLISDRDVNRIDNAGSESDRTTQQRLERWRKGWIMVNKYPVLGVGYQNWAVADGMLFGGSGAECHNIFIECMSELGYVGLAGFIMLICSTFRNNYESRKILKKANAPFLFNLSKGFDLALVGYLITGFFVTVLYYPYFWINLGMTAALNNVTKTNLKENSASTK